MLDSRLRRFFFTLGGFSCMFCMFSELRRWGTGSGELFRIDKNSRKPMWEYDNQKSLWEAKNELGATGFLGHSSCHFGKSWQPHHRLFRSPPQNYMTSRIMYINQLYHHQHAMQRIRWEWPGRNLGRGSQKEIWRNSGSSSFLARELGQLGRPHRGPRSQFTDCWLARHCTGSAIAPAKTVAGPSQGNDPIFTEVVESKSSVNLGGGRCPLLASNNPQQVSQHCAPTPPNYSPICSQIS